MATIKILNYPYLHPSRPYLHRTLKGDDQHDLHHPAASHGGQGVHSYKLGPPKPVEPRKKPSYLPLYWLFNRDPYNSLL